MKAKKLISLALLLAVLLSLMIPAAFAEGRKLHIKTAEDIAEFANNCTLDTYSKGLTVILDNDIDLNGVEFYPIPTFSGVFDGADHKISNVRTVTNGSHQGFFRYIQADGIVKNLRIEGEIAPEGSQNKIGGIVGVNYGAVTRCSFSGRVSGVNHVGGICGENQGTLKYCVAEGSVEGKQATGGIAGKNTGIITECKNKADVNTSINEKGLELDKLSLMDVTNLELTSAEDPNVVTDSGGIAGFSTGLIEGSINRGTVGYQHYGYNIGGIAGRQSGHVKTSRNYAEIFGRKDVGGIIGQMEPYLELANSVDLGGEILALHNMVSAALGNVTDMNSHLNDSLEHIKDDSGDMLDKINPDRTEAGSKNNFVGSSAAFDNENLKAVNLSSVPEFYAAPPEIVPGTPDVNPGGGGSDPEIIDPGTGPEIIDPGFNGGGANSDDYKDYLESLTEEVINLNHNMNGSRGRLVSDLNRVSAQIGNIILIIGNLVSGKDRTAIEDISDKLGMDDVDGRVDSCVNYGIVEADRNVGGIAGAMGIEYEFDLEGSLTESFNRSNLLAATYQTKCVNINNINEGVVQGKKDNIGGICGLSELGIIKACEGYGTVSSQEGGCVGGVAGRSESDIYSCYAMCNLDGNTNIGGIAGYGTVIKDCGSLVGIVDITNPCCGAIAGWADVTAEGLIENNVYVHEMLGAVDGISYENKAVRNDYSSFLKTEGLPERFRSLSISYVADGKEVGKLEFTYGGSIDESKIPPVPEKEGYTGQWPQYDYSKLYFSDTVEAVYSSRQAAIASKDHRADSPLSLILLEGDFPEDTKILINKFSGSEPENIDGKVLEKWVMRIEEAGEKPSGGYSVRFAAPEVDGKVKLYSYDGERWSEIKTVRNGSYLTFPASDEELVFCAAETEDNSTMTIIVCAVSGIAALIIIFIMVKSHSKKKAAAAETAEKSAEVLAGAEENKEKNSPEPQTEKYDKEE